MSQWATYNAEAARTLKSVHQERLEFTTALLKEMGADSPASTAEILYSYLVGHNQLAKYISFEPSAQSKATLKILGLRKSRARSKAKRGRTR